MAVDKLVDSTQLDTDLTSVANAIRTKGGTSGQLAFPSGFITAVNSLPSSSSIVITSQPTDQTVAVGETATFSVIAENANLVYYWLWWSNINNYWQGVSTSTSGYSGVRTSTMTVEATAARNGFKFICLVSNGTDTIVTNLVTIHVT